MSKSTSSGEPRWHIIGGWIWLLLGCVLGASARPARADSALELLAGFDRERIATTFPVDDAQAAGELAKLLYRLENVESSLAERAGRRSDAEPSGAEPARLGDAVRVDGRIDALERLAVPGPLGDLLGFAEIQKLTLATGSPGSGAPKVVFTQSLPAPARAGDRVSGVGIVIGGSSADAPPVAAAPLQWCPAEPVRTGWRLLAEAGADISLMPEAAERDRQPLTAEDTEAFYSLLAAAAQVGLREAADLPPARRVQPVELLKKPDRYVGQWIRMRLETVRITRVAVPEPNRRRQIGSDHYYQIDAVGDLGDVQIQVQLPDGEAAVFTGTYPVSMVSTQLPESLHRRIRQRAGGDATVALIDVPIVVEGFFYRLWSYESGFVPSDSGAAQFGPLIIAAKLNALAPRAADPIGVSLIGWVAAAAAILAILATFVWSRRTSRRDEQIRRRRQERESSQLWWPSEGDDAVR